jgi:hypothetical protein
MNVSTHVRRFLVRFYADLSDKNRSKVFCRCPLGYGYHRVASPSSLQSKAILEYVQ